MPTLTAGDQRRRDILKFVRGFQKKNGFGPSVQQIADDAGIGKTAVRHHLEALKEDGKVTSTPGLYRSLRAK